MNPSELENLDQQLRSHLALYPAARPFICKGMPKRHAPMLLGYNPATRMSRSWLSDWSLEFGYDYETWQAKYIEDRAKSQGRGGRNPRVSNTRLRIERLRNRLSDDLIETNIWSIPSRDVGSLTKDSRKASLLPLLVTLFRPSLIVVHGKDAQNELERLQLNDVAFKDSLDPSRVRIVETYHFSRLSYSEIDRIR